MLATSIFSITFASSSIVSLKDHYPQKYVVQEGDTIYDIAEKYLNKPWEWKKIWRDNKHVKNPKRLYPGTVLTLQYDEGKPYLRVLRYGTYKLSPQARPRPAQKAIPPIPLSDIKPFLNGSRVFDKDELSTAGYVLAFKEQHLRGGQDEQVYVKNLEAQGKGTLSYAIYREDGMYMNPIEPKICLGYKAEFVGDSQLIKPGDPATLELTQITQGVRLLDRVLPNDKKEFDLYFEPKAPDSKIGGLIIDVLGGLEQVANNQVIVLNQGKNQRLEPGDVIAVYLKDRYVPNPYNKDADAIKLPKHRIGEAMIFRSFTHTAFALVVSASRAIKIGDKFTNP